MAIAIVRQLSEAQILDLCRLYRETWWASDRTLKDVRRMLAHSDIVLGLHDDQQDRLVGFARILTDSVYKAFLLDVMVAESYRGLGLGRYLIDTVLTLPELASVRDIQLYCLPDMVAFYEKWDFSADLQGALALRRRRPSN